MVRLPTGARRGVCVRHDARSGTRTCTYTARAERAAPHHTAPYSLKSKQWENRSKQPRKGIHAAYTPALSLFTGYRDRGNYGGFDFSLRARARVTSEFRLSFSMIQGKNFVSATEFSIVRGPDSKTRLCEQKDSCRRFLHGQLFPLRYLD